MTNEHSLNARARQQALEKVMLPHNLAPATVTYSTYGHLLICGAEDQIRLAAARIRGMASITLLVTEKISTRDESQLEAALAAVPDLRLYRAAISSSKGFLGQFQISVEHQGQQENLAKIAQNRVHFDLILNLAEESLFAAELAPAGYFNARPDSAELQALISALPDYIGEFEKPRYFQINNDICAHSSRGQTGCSRCLDVCPADAIRSIDQLISIEPHLCHGAGGCATACPTGAISYALPQPVRMHDYLQRLIDAYLQAGGAEPVILFHDHEQGLEQLNTVRTELADNVIPVQLEELAAAGQETWLCCLAAGATRVLLLDTPALPESMRALLQRELKVTGIMLQGLGYSAQQVSLLSSTELLQQPALQNIPLMPQGRIEETNKRAALFAALDQLIDQNGIADQDFIPLPAGSPFGQVNVDHAKCTLCLSCVAVCPTQALTAGGEKPALNFTEQSCVQCGMCESSCPEQAINLTPRLSLLPERSQSVEIHAEEAFECIRCSKPFAPRSTVEKMLSKLSGHRMFQGDAINRLKMCEDCRVGDIYTDLAANPEKQLEL
ncbi:4Fe-4S binding protein [Neptuniibacter halophilus]|uniref:4Fe-4S binding protein n=1 Tax=Neptuniibacter halophilus TaxID=651666 RepID=UPI0025726F3A|nr:4Fe-4S binding protein [Neptuniibacter halophilus]